MPTSFNMSSNIVIEFRKVSKTYSISRMRYGRLSEDLHNVVSRLFTPNKPSLHKEKLWALKDVSFKIHKGQCVGIIGKNGSGKSTILKLISKVTYCQNGKISVNGNVGAFVELGAGLHPELSGRENIYLYGSILGMKKRDVSEKYDRIVEFAGIEKFIDTPIKRYSSGMYARLGFSVVAFMDPDILLIDEVLAVGDKPFQEKCLAKMRSFAKEKTIVFVSHNLDAVKSICNKVIYLEAGKIKMQGYTRNVIAKYLEDLDDENNEKVK